MAENEKQIDALEAAFPAVSGSAFAHARDAALASGQSVMETANGAIYEVFPDGRRNFVRSISAPVRVDQNRFVIPPDRQ